MKCESLFSSVNGARGGGGSGGWGVGGWAGWGCVFSMPP